MPLSPGTRLGQYEVITTIGAGGMGEVFRARDTKLHRDVALKILPDSFVHDADRLARFEREAQVLASLNHQHIAAIYGVEESESVKALVLELVDGVTLADRIAAGPVPLDELIPIAQQIADALEGAHARGIVHRDLKPANIKIRSDGTVKVLDFGLAKALDPAASNADPLESPTITARATQMGTILGTAAYMAPEQAKGKPVDKRADIWAFGCVLYEMLTGRRAFAGEDVSDTMAFVLTKEPEWSALPANVPASLARLVRRCLQKDSHRRLADIGDARLELEEALTTDRSEVALPAISHPAGWRRLLPWGVAGAAALALGVVVVLWAPWRTNSSGSVLRMSTHIGADASLTGAGGSAITVSRDGRVLVVSARKAGALRPSLWVRRLDQLSAAELSGTDGGTAPVMSPDGHWIAFFAAEKLKKIAVSGGAVSTLADAPAARGAHWADDNTIFYSPDRVATGVMRISASGGQPQAATVLGPGEATHRHPHALPGTKALLYSSHATTSGFDQANIMVKPLPDGSPRVVVRGGYNARYLRSGHLVYMREGALQAVPFDLRRLELTGTPVPVIEGIVAGTLTGAAHVDIADDGTAVYLPGREPDASGPLMWMTKGGATPLRATRSVTINLQFSPDGRRLALDSYDGRQWDVWIYDWNRETMTRLTDDPSIEQRPVWFPDGTRIVFASRRFEGERLTFNLYWRRVDGSGTVERLTDSSYSQAPGAWHPSGKFFAFSRNNPDTSWDVMILPIDGSEDAGWKPGTPTAFVNQRSNDLEPTFSPDGRFIAYQSDDSGRPQIYVRPFPGPGAREQISSDGGAQPLWSRTSQELLYLADGRIMSAPYSIVNGALRPEKARLWSQQPFPVRAGPSARAFDLHPDGLRIAFASLPPEDTEGTRDHVVLLFNFFEELRRITSRPIP